MEEAPSILESQVKKETYLLRTKKRFQNIKRFRIVKKYKEEESELRKKVISLLKRFGVKVEGAK
jgi:hypothetical protein